MSQTMIGLPWLLTVLKMSLRETVNAVLELSRNPNLIRNVGLSAQVDHGKTTLSDVILAEGGVISPHMAGRVLYLDYLDEEQRRGITIKTAAISLIMRAGEAEYVLNLIDTPGHVDFSGKVVRAMRLMDGVIILVDAVEGIMAQTESYLRVALREWVRPILFINKVDRLIGELRMGPGQIQRRLEEIITQFNELIGLFGTDEQKREWAVSPARETVVFGSALQRWGFTLKEALQKGVKFSTIMKLSEYPDRLAKLLPLGPLIARIIYEKVPSPVESQKYRLPHLWVGGEPPRSAISCDADEPTIFYASKIVREAGRIMAVGRVFSGVLRPGEYYSKASRKWVRVHSVRLLRGASTVHVDDAMPGMVVGVIVDVRAGDTLVNSPVAGSMKEPEYVALPVVYVAVEPKRVGEFDKLMRVLERVAMEDPNIAFRVDRDTGQILVGGIGELHLEMVLKEVEREVPIESSEPIVSYREALVSGCEVRGRGFTILLKSLIEDDRVGGAIRRPGTIEGNIIELKGFQPDEREAVSSLVADALKSGPLVGEPVIGALVVIKKEQDSEADVGQVLTLLAEALSRSRTEICEPYYSFSVATYADYMGAVLGELNRRGGKVESVETVMGSLVKVSGIIPVRSSLDLPSVVRSIARGRASIQLEFYDYVIVRGKERDEIIREILSRKGLL